MARIQGNFARLIAAALVVIAVVLGVVFACRPAGIGAGPVATGAKADAAPSDVAAEIAQGTLPANSNGHVAAPPGKAECSDGVDNDGDGLSDWGLDGGCWGPDDPTEKALPRAKEQGFSTWDFPRSSVVVYVSKDGDDSSTGTSPENPVRSIRRALALVRKGQHDFIRLRRGDVWHEEYLDPIKSGRDPDHPLVVMSYGTEPARPKIVVRDHFINFNGSPAGSLALLDLHLLQGNNVPKSPQWSGRGGPLLRLNGLGAGILIEGCRLQYGGVVVQGARDSIYRNVELRHNVIDHAYHVETCGNGNNGDPKYRPQGLFAKGIDGLLIEGNLFDHNGWNEEVESACATIYNHNSYLNASNLVIRNNVFARASSIHVKLKETRTRGMRGIEFVDNFFVEGEFGISAGGVGHAPGRFFDVRIEDNAFYGIGRSRPTGRSLSWGIDLRDHERSTISRNLFLHQHGPELKNVFGIRINGKSQKDVTVEKNSFYRVDRRGIYVTPLGPHRDVSFIENTFVDTEGDTCFFEYPKQEVTGYALRGNRYLGASGDDWLCVHKRRLSVADWASHVGEKGAVRLESSPFSEPQRTLETYAETLGLEPTLGAFLQQALEQTRAKNRPELRAAAINAYLREGFGMPPQR